MSSATDRSLPMLGSPDNVLRVAIVGSGPSGFYAAEALLKLPLAVTVDMFERLPVPFGPVRHGVAPDHPKLKMPALVFDKIAQMPGFRFIDNVTVGRHISADQLHETHHAVIYASGAASDRQMGIPGESLPGSRTATAFVGWYNGASHALEVLAESRIREIHIVGRRGPAQAKFTNKELRELGDIPGCGVEVSAADLALNAASATELESKTNFVAAKNVEILQSWSESIAAPAGRRIVVHFLQTPKRLEGEERVTHFVLERNRLAGEPFAQEAVGTGETVALPCDLVFRSIGYRGRSIPGVPFDDIRGVIPNDGGRVTGKLGMYVVGWIKRGPSGIIGTNRADAVATVQSLQADLSRLDPSPRPGAAGLYGTHGSPTANVVGYADWLRIDSEETRRGALVEKPREKFTRVAEMLGVVTGAGSVIHQE